MSAEQNIKVIQTVYEAFSRGDLGVILDAVTDDVDWATEAAGRGAPWYGPHKGRDQVTDFFTQFGSAMEVEEFTPTAYAGTDTDVHSVVRCRTKSRATGRGVDMELHHYFRFEDGQIAYYRGTEDTAQVEAALKG
ncbi:MAG TPA: nuclear transport factor 2 family protein [Acidimicrobiales bacterium]|nr:nuclear transport factor 2 family protein [Acidimicrobiales bacterium]